MVYRNETGDTASVSSIDPISACVDRSDRIWLGTGDDGLWVFDPRNGKFTNIDRGRKFITRSTISPIIHIVEDNSGDIWLMGADGEVLLVTTTGLVRWRRRLATPSFRNGYFRRKFSERFADAFQPRTKLPESVQFKHSDYLQSSVTNVGITQGL